MSSLKDKNASIPDRQQLYYEQIIFFSYILLKNYQNISKSGSISQLITTVLIT